MSIAFVFHSSYRHTGELPCLSCFYVYFGGGGGGSIVFILAVGVFQAEVLLLSSGVLFSWSVFVLCCRLQIRWPLLQAFPVMWTLSSTISSNHRTTVVS